MQVTVSRSRSKMDHRRDDEDQQLSCTLSFLVYFFCFILMLYVTPIPLQPIQPLPLQPLPLQSLSFQPKPSSPSSSSPPPFFLFNCAWMNVVSIIYPCTNHFCFCFFRSMQNDVCRALPQGSVSRSRCNVVP